MEYVVDIERYNKSIEGYEKSPGVMLVNNFILHMQGDKENVRWDSMKWYFFATCNGRFGFDVTKSISEYALELDADWSPEKLEKAFGDYWAAIVTKLECQEFLNDKINFGYLSNYYAASDLEHGVGEKADKEFHYEVEQFVKDKLLPLVNKHFDLHGDTTNKATNTMIVGADPAPGFRRYIFPALVEIVKGSVYELERYKG